MNHTNLVILAAGKSQRMGISKGLIQYKNQNLLDYSIQKFLLAGGKNIIVVISKEGSIYQKELKTLQENAPITLVINPDPDRGPFSSLQCGLSKVPINESSFILPVDTPAPSTELWQTISKEMNNELDVIKPSFNHRGGHPILISSSLIKEILQRNPLIDTSRLDFLINDLDQNRCKFIETHESVILENLNTPNDLNKLKNR